MLNSNNNLCISDVLPDSKATCYSRIRWYKVIHFSKYASWNNKTNWLLLNKLSPNGTRRFRIGFTMSIDRLKGRHSYADQRVVDSFIKGFCASKNSLYFCGKVLFWPFILRHIKKPHALWYTIEESSNGLYLFNNTIANDYGYGARNFIFGTPSRAFENLVGPKKIAMRFIFPINKLNKGRRLTHTVTNFYNFL